MTRVLTTARELFAACEVYRAGGERVGLVPTMGALHAGHLSLIAAVRAAGATRVVVSIFVNPLQFAAHEDLTKYPRTFDEDLSGCRAGGADIVYAPTPATMYPAGFQSHVEVEHVTQAFEGAIRPTHFRGVATVVTKLFNATGPCIAAFGRKDYQQWRTIDRLVRDLDLPVRVLACPIVRDPDGLAMSSRNRYLDAAARARATAMYRGLQAASQAFAHGQRDTSRLVELARHPLEVEFDSIDYVSLVDPDTLEASALRAAETSVMLAAARLGNTRLIDNCLLGQECLGPRVL
jgi:pantoate--beta-alanine ligase